MKSHTVSIDRLTVFALLWAVATLIHQASFTGWISENRPLGWLLTGLAALVVIWPRNLGLFLTMVGVSAIYSYQRLPYIPNHILFELFVSLTILAGIAWGTIKVRKLGLVGIEARDRVFESFASTVRFEVLVLYFFATWHKLNWDFFDPEVSCGGALYDRMAETLPGLSQATWIHIGCIIATLLFEAGIPLLLIFQRTRATGIVIGFFFHFVLGFVPHGGVYSFSTLMMALLFLFTPPELLEGLEHTARSLGTRRPSLRLDLLYRGLAILGVAATFLLWAWGWQRAGYMSVAKVGFVQYLAWAAVLATVFCLAMRSDSVRWDDFHARLLPANAILWLFPVLITLNGMSPYLGSKTQTSFAMFSNLRTEEDRTNHLLMPGSLQIWDLQRDTVEIVESNHPKFDGLRKNELRIPYIQFRLDVGRYDGDIAVTYLRNGALKRLQRSGDQIDGTVEALEPLPYLARKWLRFRPFNIGPKMECRH